VNIEDFIVMSDEQYVFGRASLVFLEDVFPEVVDEMRGLCAGQGIDYVRLAAWLLAMRG